MIVKKNVIYILHDLKIGGVEIALLSALPELIERYNFHLICFGVVDPEIKSNLTNSELNCIHEVGAYSPISYLRAYRLVRNFKVEIMIASLWRSNFFASIVKVLNKKITYISFKHSTRLAHYADKIAHRISLGLADEIWVDSQSTATFIQENSKRNLDTIKISFVLRKLSASAQKDPSPLLRFLFIGRISAVKRIDLLIRFAEDMKNHNLPVQIDIYGTDEDKLWENIYSKESNAKNLKITYKGAVSYNFIEYIYPDYSYYIQMSDYEGMAISVMEAMMAGLVCFVRPVGEIRNYSDHLLSAVHLKSTNESDWLQFISESVCILQDEGKWNEISNNAAIHWQNVKLYSEHLCENIDRNLR